ncbi:MAG: hypothetical protein ABEL97_14560 [Salinibacter sp.]
MSPCAFAVLCGLLLGSLPGGPDAVESRTVRPPPVRAAPQAHLDLGPPFGAESPAPIISSSPAQGGAQSAAQETSILEAVVLGIAALLFLVLFAGIPVSVAAVTAAMDGSWLRTVLSGVGVVGALAGGALTGMLGLSLTGQVVEMTLTLGLLVWTIAGGGLLFAGGFFGLRALIRRWLRALPPERARTWRQTLTGGAVIGVGFGTLSSLLRSLFAAKGGGFGGYGGGHFGGGGASGSWSGASAGGGAASAGVASAKTKTETGTAVAVTRGPEPPEPGTPDATTDTSPSTGLFGGVLRWVRHLQWYHAATFALIAVAFSSLVKLTVQALEVKTALVLFGLVGAYALWRRRSTDGGDAAAAFRGGRASASWS